ncbi:MAG TPA: POTRA domain-containing protein, partial [Spirochaetota bacterium]|nr:POTRA domain-containing protein [Spirochaetota bacterium]
LFAAEVTRIEIIGNTVDINLQSITSQTPASLSERDIRAIGTAVTAAYHSRGYTTTQVDRLMLRRDGTLQVHILESHVKDITVSGVSIGKAAKIRAFLAPVINQVYNRFQVLERAEALKREFNLNRISVSPLITVTAPMCSLPLQCVNQLREMCMVESVLSPFTASFHPLVTTTLSPVRRLTYTGKRGTGRAASENLKVK